MRYKKFGDCFFIKLERGDKVIEKITEVCNKENVNTGSLSGIGAVDNVTISIFDIKTKRYSDENIKKDLEIISLSGNITLVDKKPFVHAHIVLSDKEMKAIGGHLKEAVISVTGEIILRKIKGVIERKKDEEIGLNLWDM